MSAPPGAPTCPDVVMHVAYYRQGCRLTTLAPHGNVMDMSDTPPAKRSQAVSASWQNVPDRTARTAPARAAFIERFKRQVDPNNTLPEPERTEVAEHARREFYARLGEKSGAARRAKRAAQTHKEGSNP